MSRINTNVSSLIAVRNLNTNQSSLQQSLQRLSTGYRINAGKDDPAGLIASENLRSEQKASSQAISNVLMPLLLEIGDEGGLEKLIWHKINIRSGIYMFKGSLTNIYLSQRFNLKYTDLNLLIASQR